MTKSKFVSLAVLPKSDKYTILDASKIVAVQWEQHDERMPYVIFCEGGHVFQISSEEFENLKEKAEFVGVDLSWITGVSNTFTDRNE